jgi:hypothetical protein
MVFRKSDINEILDAVSNLEDFEALQSHGGVLQEVRTRNEEELAEISSKLVTLGKGLLANASVRVGRLGLTIKPPSFRAYLSVDSDSDLPYVRLTLSDVKSNFKESTITRLDSNFREQFLQFVGASIYKLVSTAIALENVDALNALLEEIRTEIVDDGLKVAFDLSYALSEKPIAYIANNTLVLGTSVEKMFDLVSPNSPIETLFFDEDNYITRAVKEKIKEDWTSSSNPLVFIRKHNKYLIGLVVGDLNTRRTQRVDVLIKNSFTLSADSLKYRKKAIAHKLEKEDGETYISVWEKTGSDDEPVEILSPINTKSLTFKE